MATDETNAIAQEISKFRAKWSDYFKSLNSLASDNQLEAAIQQSKIFQLRMKKIDQELKSRALCDTIIQFNPSDTFNSVQSHLGELAELSTKFTESQTKGKIIFIYGYLLFSF